MRKFGIIIVLALMMSGCSAAETFERVEDVYAGHEAAEVKTITFTVPEDAASQVMESEHGRIYFCDGYEIMVQTLSSGDLNRTLQTLTGFARDNLTVMETASSDFDRYECVWTAAGEAGDQVGRVAILDDGKYHYCLSVMAVAQEAGSLQNSWNDLFTSIDLHS